MSASHGELFWDDVEAEMSGGVSPMMDKELKPLPKAKVRFGGVAGAGTGSVECGIDYVDRGPDGEEGFRIRVEWHKEDAYWYARMGGFAEGTVLLGTGDTKEAALLDLCCSVACHADACHAWWKEAVAGAVTDADAETPEQVRRFEVIDHRGVPEGAHVDGRRLVANDTRVTLQYQDDGRTLKVFLDDCAKEGR